MDAPTAPGESRIFPAQRSPITSPAAAQRPDQGRERGVVVAAAPLEPAPTAQRSGQRRRRRAGERREEIERTIEVVGLKAGDVVAEIGAGNGRFSLRFAEVVGPEGRVYANELDADGVERIRRRAEQDDLGNLIAVQGAVDDTNLPDACCDALMMRMVYHMLTDPEPMARSFYHALKPGGVLAILEGDPEPGQDNARGVQSNRAGMGIDPQIVIAELAEVGFQLDRHIKDWTGADYALVFRKPHARD
jgi:predicted methyltransferase